MLLEVLIRLCRRSETRRRNQAYRFGSCASGAPYVVAIGIGDISNMHSKHSFPLQTYIQ